MLEVSAILGVAACGALWRMAFAQGSMKKGMSGRGSRGRTFKQKVTAQAPAALAAVLAHR